MPKNSSRYSARFDNSSGSTTMTAAPTAGPSTQPAPPTTHASRNRIDCENGNEPGATNASKEAKMPPANPANTAESMKAAALTLTGLSPIEHAATSASRTATIALPQAEPASRQNNSIELPATAIASSAISRSVKIVPAMDGGGTPISPFDPPVSSRHSMLRCWTMNANAMVTI